MRIRTVPSSWFEKEGRRLDCGPYMSGAIEAKVLLERLPVEKARLFEVTKGGLQGIFNGPRFPRYYVDDPSYGTPFLGSTDILAADLSWLPYLSKRQVENNPGLLIEEGWTLITCSGTIGRMAYARPEMKGMAGSQHFMRVVPDPEKILPGYLYAYLSSRFGVPLVVSGTYGAIIQHIEPSHIADLPVPRLAADIEELIHSYVVNAAEQRSEASNLLKEATDEFLEYFDFARPIANHQYIHPNVTTVGASSLLKRLDAYYFSQWNQDAFAMFQRLPADQRMCLGDVTAELYIPDIFKRLYADDLAYGFPYLTGSDVYTLSPVSDKYLSKKISNVDRLVLKDGMILVQDSGQIGGLIGRPVAVGRYLNGFACTNNMVRIVPRTKTDQGFILTALSSEYGLRLLTREATGSSIPHLEEGRIRRIQIPWPSEDARSRLGAKALQAINLRDTACELENRARTEVEKAINGLSH